jgi:branched-subunit amino acid ABC-type transport system permease component
VQPFVGLTFGPITFLICVLGGLGNMIGSRVTSFPVDTSISFSKLVAADAQAADNCAIQTWDLKECRVKD